jgi:hypothetical protein
VYLAIAGMSFAVTLLQLLTPSLTLRVGITRYSDTFLISREQFLA